MSTAGSPGRHRASVWGVSLLAALLSCRHHGVGSAAEDVRWSSGLCYSRTCPSDQLSSFGTHVSFGRLALLQASWSGQCCRRCSLVIGIVLQSHLSIWPTVILWNMCGHSFCYDLSWAWTGQALSSPTSARQDMTFAVDWALKTIIYLSTNKCENLCRQITQPH